MAISMDTKDNIFSYPRYEEGALVDLKEVYVKESEDKHLKNVLGDEGTCRICKQIVTCEFTSVEEGNVDVHRKFVPEVDFRPKQHVICKACVNSVDKQTNFVNNSLTVKKEINDVGYDTAIESLSSIKCEDIKIKSEKNYSFTSFPKLKEEPLNSTNGCRFEYVDTTSLTSEDIEIKSEENLSGALFRTLKAEPVDCSSDFSSENVKITNNSMHKRKRKRRGSKDKVRDSSEGQIHKCNSCDYKTDRRSNLTQHQLRHKDISEIQMYQCDSCDYKSIYKNSLKQHQLRHKNIPEGDKFKCHLCEYKTVHKHHLTRHQLIHTDVPEEQMYRCELCDYKTIHRNCFARHESKHKNAPKMQLYECDSCDYNTIYKGCLVQHQQIHENVPEDQIYKCNSYDYKTVLKYNLTQH